MKTVMLKILAIAFVATPAAAQQVQSVASGGISFRPPSYQLTTFQLHMPYERAYEFYGLLNVDRFTADYFNQDNERIKRLTATRSELRAGLTVFKSKAFNLSAGVRGSHVDSKFYYSNPDITLKLDLIRSDFIDLQFYSKVMFPVKQSLLDPTAFAEGGALEKDMEKATDKTVIVGINPTGKIYLFGLYLFLSGDGKAIRYTKSHEYPSREGRPDLNDNVYRYSYAGIAGASFSLGVFNFEASGSYDTRYAPNHYYNICNYTWEYRYQIERVSYTKIKTTINVSKSASISGEAYYIRNGFFEKDRVDTEMRFKNIVSVNVAL